MNTRARQEIIERTAELILPTYSIIKPFAVVRDQ